MEHDEGSKGETALSLAILYLETEVIWSSQPNPSNNIPEEEPVRQRLI